MRGNEFLDKMELTDPAYVEAADARQKRKPTVWIRWVAIAACLALMTYAVVRFFTQDAPVELPDLPMLSISENNEGMGHEGYMAYDISELVNANPWDQSSKLTTLPVYKNPRNYDAHFNVTGVDHDQMRALLLDAAGRLGLDASKLAITEEADPPIRFTVEADGLTITVDHTLTVTVYFKPEAALPEGYNFTHFASYEDMAAAAEYLKTEYGDFIGIDDPQVDIYDGGYNIYAQQRYSLAFFDGSGDAAEQIINYNFNRVTFSCGDEGKLRIARISQPDLSIQVGDYPIITWKQARKLLSEGNYITSVPYEMPGLKYVKKVELVYRTGEMEKYYMPYYRFYVELPEEKRENGLKDYGAYYVPAVVSSYISNIPTWDGRFNG